MGNILIATVVERVKAQKQKQKLPVANARPLALGMTAIIRPNSCRRKHSAGA